MEINDCYLWHDQDNNLYPTSRNPDLAAWVGSGMWILKTSQETTVGSQGFELPHKGAPWINPIPRKEAPRGCGCVHQAHVVYTPHASSLGQNGYKGTTMNTSWRPKWVTAMKTPLCREYWSILAHGQKEHFVQIWSHWIPALAHRLRVTSSPLETGLASLLLWHRLQQKWSSEIFASSP